MNVAALFGAVALLGATIAAPAAASAIDTSGGYAAKIDYFGARYTPAYGQTFTVGSDNALNGFTFYLGGGAARVRAYVYSWSGVGALGAALYASDARNFGGTAGDAFEALRFDVGALDLRAGQRYVAFLTTAGLNQPAGSESSWMPTAGSFGSNAYRDGDFVFSNAGDSLDAIVGQPWDDVHGVYGDVQFTADFSPGATAGAGVPEPAAWAMLIGGFGLAGGVLRRRRTRTSVRFA
ncbi:PEPxxWA-CTERM sorting domain-containing protein [uncultured Sphingomonas sp.]|uniref:PEPxxWA-CTERM sorting domain-containing protein n=1 Tax=uncultured Sphingomonas sp. TaxID=158754 RepID=UPI0025D504CF|nr:PEPxxWA-CTERM sorting domain-containing protein [uncultured Sphingomonas sp.]